MPRQVLEFKSVTFCYPSASEPLFSELSVAFTAGWTGIVGPNGCGKSTLLRLACAQLEPTSGVLAAPAPSCYCAQRTDVPPPELDAFLLATDAAACSLRGRLALESDWPSRWRTLSHGERKRAQIAVALWLRPSLLAIDEPTNHIDRGARRLLAEALAGFADVGLLVSHDRELLDRLCARCLMLTPPQAVMRPGGYSQARRAERAELEHARTRRQHAADELARLRAEAARRRAEAARADKKRSKRRLDRHDSDGRARIDCARVSGKDGQAGRFLRQLEGRVAQAERAVELARVRAAARMGVAFTGEKCRRAVLLRPPAGQIPLGDARVVEHPELAIEAGARIAISGDNGCGKSTLVRRMLGRLDLPRERVVYLAQETALEDEERTLRRFRELTRAERGAVLSHVNRLGSDVSRVQESGAPSPGELRKLILALGMLHRPHLMVMDEPTNHLDLPSIECLEAALGEYEGALVIVSHEERFVGALCRERWEFQAGSGANRLVRVRHAHGRRE